MTHVLSFCHSCVSLLLTTAVLDKQLFLSLVMYPQSPQPSMAGLAGLNTGTQQH
jgi:hypothetical protein